MSYNFDNCTPVKLEKEKESCGSISKVTGSSYNHCVITLWSYVWSHICSMCDWWRNQSCNCFLLWNQTRLTLKRYWQWKKLKTPLNLGQIFVAPFLCPIWGSRKSKLFGQCVGLSHLCPVSSRLRFLLCKRGINTATSQGCWKD